MVSFQPNMQVQDDLAALFSRNLTFNPELQTQAPAPKVEEEVKQTFNPAPTNPTPSPIVYSITQHYHHSSHLARQPSYTEQAQELQRPSSEPPQSEQYNSETILAQHGVDPAALSPSQLQLFRILDQPQQMRLIELWRIAPPTRGEDNPALEWTSTTLEQEELLARMRYERMVQAEQQNTTMSLDGTQVQTNDGRWLAPAISQNVEPYMMSGYEQLMQKEFERQQAEARPKDVYNHFGTSVGGQTYTPATDPVYNRGGNEWVRQQEMENQYGSFQQFGGPAGTMEAMEIL